MGKSKKITVGYWYLLAAHFGIGIGPLDRFLAIRAGDKNAWEGSITGSDTISVDAENLWGGEKDQGGIVTDVDVMMGEAEQAANPYLASVFGAQQPAWRGIATVVFKGGKYGAMNPYPRPPSFLLEKIVKGWDTDPCWYPEKARITAGMPLWGPPGLAAEIFTSNGTWSRPPGYTGAIRITCIGGGGGGAVAIIPSGFGYAECAGAGGGGGGWAMVKVDLSVSSLPDEIPVVVGDGGAPEGDGTHSSFGDTLVYAGGGKTPDGSYSTSAGTKMYGGDVGSANVDLALWISLGDGVLEFDYISGGSPGTVGAYSGGSDDVSGSLGGGGGGGGGTQRIGFVEGHPVLVSVPGSNGGFGGFPSPHIASGGDRGAAPGDSGQTGTPNAFDPELGTIYGGGGGGGGQYGVDEGSGGSGGAGAWPGGGGGGAASAIEDEYAPDDFTVSIAPGEFAGRGADGVVVVAYDSEVSLPLGAMNPAHMLYYALTHSEMRRESTDSISSASFTAAADWFFDQGFGLCTQYDPGQESISAFIERIGRVAGCSVTRSRITAEFHLDIANGEYELEALPILGDDDILEFSEVPTSLDNAVNSVSVRYFDPLRKESVITPAIRAMGLVRQFGVIHQTLDYPEIPSSALALRVAERELRARCTPSRTFSLRTTRVPFAWRPGTYFRLQCPKRGIADMVCLLGEKNTGTLRSGAISLTATQDIYSLPVTTYVEIEEGVDPAPDQAPVAITAQRAFEVPYYLLAANLSAADLAVLDAAAGFLLAVAVDPSTSRDFTLTVSPHAADTFEDNGNGDFCPTALVNEAAGPADVSFTLDDQVRLDLVLVGQPVLWDEEIARVVAIDREADPPAIELARGCADTVPTAHAAASRLWFYGAGAAADQTEYTDAEDIDVKLLTNTGSRQLDPGSATTLEVTFDQRANRPYPPGQFQINGTPYPATINEVADLEVSWAHRDRLVQADLLVDTAAAGVGPEAGTTYSGEVLDADTDGLLEDWSGEAGTSRTVLVAALGATVNIKVRLWSVRDGLASRQVHEWVVERTPVELGGGAVASAVGAADISKEVPLAGDATAGADAAGALASPPPGGEFLLHTGASHPYGWKAYDSGWGVGSFDVPGIFGDGVVLTVLGDGNTGLYLQLNAGVSPPSSVSQLQFFTAIEINGNVFNAADATFSSSSWPESYAVATWSWGSFAGLDVDTEYPGEFTLSP